MEAHLLLCDPLLKQAISWLLVFCSVSYSPATEIECLTVRNHGVLGLGNTGVVLQELLDSNSCSNWRPY